MSVSDYIGRTADVLAFREVRYPEGSQLVASLCDETSGGELCTGMVSLAQRFLIRLLTVQGSIPYMEEEGCEFLEWLYDGRIRAPYDVYTAFATSLVDIRKQFVKETTASTPLDEVFVTAQLTQVSLTATQIIIHVTIESAAGTTLTFIQPIDTALRGDL